MKDKVKSVFVLSTAVLSFISFWRASAIVLCDLGSSAFYSGGIAAKTYGEAFPYFIIAVMLLAGLLLMAYIESSSIFTRGGIYVLVNKSMGKTMAKLSVSALIFDYLLTGPVSSISAGLYLSHFIKSLFEYFKISISFNSRIIAVIFAVCVIIYFWWKNIKGIKESSESNIKIVIFSSFVGFFLLLFSIITVVKKGFVMPAFNIRLSNESLGFIKYMDFLKPAGLLAIMIAFGHSVLALSGLETLAQVYREIEDPKIKNLKKSVFIIFIFSLIFTGALTFLSAVIIPFEKIASNYSENLLSGLAMELYIPSTLKLFLSSLVVISAFLMLLGAVNTSIVGANGIINRVAEDGVLPQSVRNLHPKYGTTYIIITIIAALQIIIVILSGGDVFLLGEAYAFGVLWSLTFDLFSLIILRFKDVDRGWYYPLNIKWGKYKIPVGLFLVFIIVFSLSFINLFTKPIATLSGISFTLILYIIFSYSEKKQPDTSTDIHNIDDEDTDEKVNITVQNDIEMLFRNFKKKNKVLVPVRNPNNLVHLKWVLENFNDEECDIVVFYVKVETGYEHSNNKNEMTSDEKKLFRQVILLAEKYGKSVEPVIVLSNEPFYVILHSAVIGGFSLIVMGVSGSMGAEVQMENIALWWGIVKPSGFNSKIDVKIIWEGRILSYTLS